MQNYRGRVLRSLSPRVILAAGNVSDFYSLASRLSSSYYHSVVSGAFTLVLAPSLILSIGTNFFQVTKFKLVTKV